MKTCLIIMHSYGGGAEKVTLDLARRLYGRDFRVILACMRCARDLERHVPQSLPLLMPSRPGVWAALRNMRRVRETARHCDAVLGSLELQSIFHAAFLAPERAVAWLHKDIEGYLRCKNRIYALIYRNLLGRALRRCRAVACVSRGIAESSARLWPDLQARFRVLPNPVNIAEIRQRARCPLPETLEEVFTKPVILAVGRLAEEKAFHLLLQAHALLRLRGMDCRCCILGEGPERAALEKAIRKLGLEGSAFLPGFMDPAPVMARAAVFALCSLFEGFSLVLVEALSLGLPVVATDCPSGPREILEGGALGVLTPPGDAAALADALEKTLRAAPDPERKAAGMARAGCFSPEITLAAWSAFLEEQIAAIQQV